MGLLEHIIDVLATLRVGFPVFISHLVATFSIWYLSIVIYARITPHSEVALIRSGNVATAISFGSACLGLAIPLAFCLAGSINLYDILIWSLPVLIVQVIAFVVVDAIVGDVPRRLRDNDLACAVFLALVRLGVAAIIAGAISD